MISLTLISSFALMQGCARGSQPAAAPQANVAAPKSQVRAEMVSTECGASELSLSVEGRNGDFTGMSHDGALLVFKNTGSRTCTIPRRPQLSFTDAAGKPLALHPNIPPGMHPGPVMVPVKLGPGASAQGKMRWVTGPVYDTNTCVDIAQMSLSLPGGDLKAPLQAHLCGPSPEKLEFEQEWLQPAGTPDTAH